MAKNVCVYVGGVKGKEAREVDDGGREAGLHSKNSTEEALPRYA